MPRIIPRLGGLERDLQIVQDRIADSVDTLNAKVILQGNFLQAVALSSAGNNAIVHGLDRPPLGYFIAGRNTNANVWDTSRDLRFLNLSCNTNVTIDLWVF